ncbi:MAG: YfcC family protein [Tannerella sp.]|jgi:uncharacterized ion transporter superfamily protein YfcC|nr:YfcC family protein [Tannerella sp.]
MKKKRSIPHTYVIIFAIIVVCALLTWILPGGEYVHSEVEVDGVMTSKIAFNYVESQPQSWQIFSALFNGFVRQSGIIAFIFIMGGAFWILNSSKAIDAGIHSFLRWATRLERIPFVRKLGVGNIVIVLVMTVFSLFGAVFGMSEETIAFVIIIVPLAISMGYDSIVGVCMVYLAAHVGFAGAILNPFTIGIAQGISGLPLFSGLEYRFVCWVIVTIISIAFVLWYARKVKRHPEKSPMYEEDAFWRERGEEHGTDVVYHTPFSTWISYGLAVVGMGIMAFLYPVTSMTVGNSTITVPYLIPGLTVLFAVVAALAARKSVHFYILTVLIYSIIYLIVGVMGYKWYIGEISGLFMVMGLLSGIAMGDTGNLISQKFIDGAKDLLSAALVVGLGGGIIIILENGQVIDTILYKLAQGMEGVGQIASMGVMYVIQTCINMIIASGSAKAALTMPIMAPFSDLIGISRQTAVMAFQFEFTSMFAPTSGVLIGVLGIARIPFGKWFKWVWKFILFMVLLGFLLLIPTVTMKLNGF